MKRIITLAAFAVLASAGAAFAASPDTLAACAHACCEAMAACAGACHCC